MKRCYGISFPRENMEKDKDLVPVALQKFRDKMDSATSFTSLLGLYRDPRIKEIAEAKRKKVFDEVSPVIVTKFEGKEMGEVFTKIDDGIRNVIEEMMKINQNHKDRMEALVGNILEHYCAEYKKFSEGRMRLNPGMGVDVLKTHFEHERGSVITFFIEQIQKCAQEQAHKLEEQITGIQREIEEKVANGFTFTTTAEPGSTASVGVQSFKNFELRPSRLNINLEDSSIQKGDGDFRGEPSSIQNTSTHEVRDETSDMEPFTPESHEHDQILENNDQESLTDSQKEKTLESDRARDTNTTFRKLKQAILRKCDEFSEKRFHDCNFLRESFMDNMMQVESILGKYQNFSEVKYQRTHTRLVEVVKMAKKMFSVLRKSRYGQTHAPRAGANLVRLDDALVWLSDFRMDLLASFHSKNSKNNPFALEHSYNILKRVQGRAEESDSDSNDEDAESSENSEEEEEEEGMEDQVEEVEAQVEEEVEEEDASDSNEENP